MSVPQSIINICSGVRINNSYVDTLYFEDAAAQLNYFAGKVVKTFSAYTFLRKSWTIKVQSDMETAKTWNYLYFKNSPSGKVYYYFITNVEYVNDNTVELFLELDVIQTYLKDFSLNYSHIERQHIASNQSNTVPESFELGEYISTQKIDVSDLYDLCIVIQSTFDMITVTDEVSIDVLASNHNGIFSGLGIYAVAMEDWVAFGNKLATMGKNIEGIVNMWMYPKALINLSEGNEWGDGILCKNVAGTKVLTLSIPKPDNADNEPKLNTYPYKFLYLTNNMGNACAYHYELFNSNACEFRIEGVLSPDAQVKITPMNYKGITYNYDESMNLAGYPTCAWDGDMYKIWLAQNQNQMTLNNAQATITAGAGAVATIAGIVTANPVLAGAGATATISGVSQIMSQMAQKKDASVQPNQARGIQSGSVNISAGTHTFSFYKKETQHLDLIKNFFTRFGYAINRQGIPNIKLRSGYNFTKTIDCHIYGNICNDDLKKIESIFNQGVTFWKVPDSVGNYTIENT